MRVKYSLTKKNTYKNYTEISISNSFGVNKKIDKESIGLIKFYDNDLIMKVIKKKMDTKFKQIYELMISTDESDDDPSEGLMLCLNETDKLKKELVNKYRKFLEKEQQEFLEKKLMLLEKEIKIKLFNMQIINNPFLINPNGFGYEDVEEEKESTRRR
jgi:hypothetical protein